MSKFDSLVNLVLENVPQAGPSSGEAAKFKEGTGTTSSLTIDQILKTYSGIPYYKEVLQDLQQGDDSWSVTKKVKEYAEYMIQNQGLLKNLPPIITIDGKLQDGAHRISAIYLIQHLLKPNDVFWKNIKLDVQNYKEADKV